MPKIRHINGLPVVDAKKSIILRVTSLDVKNAKKKNQAECAAAVACKRQLGATEARIHLGRSYVRFNGKWQRYITSGALRDEIVAFDRGGKFVPGEFKLARMQPSRKGDKYRGAPNGGRGKKRRNRHIIADVRPIGIYA